MIELTRRQKLSGLGAGITGLGGYWAISGTGGKEDVFTVGSPWTPDSRDPVVNGWLWRRISVLEPLLTVDYDATVAPGLATDWRMVDDETWEFDLREGVTFHDGTELTAKTVLPSLRRAFDSSSMASVPVKSIETADNRTLTMKTDEPFSPLPAHCTRGSTCLVSPTAIADDGSVSEPIGTGPFQFESWNQGSSITASANSDYHGENASIETLVYEGITDDQTRRLKLENDELDMARILPNETVDSLELRDDITAHTYQIPRARYLVFDLDSSPFADRRVRRAVMHAVDRETIVENLLNGLGSPAVGPFPSDVTDWAADDLEPYEHDPGRARDLLAEAGWEPNGTGRTRDGDPLSVSIWTYDTRPLLPTIAQVIQTQLGEVGFEVDIEVMESSTIKERATNGSFDAVLWSNSVLWYPDPDRLSDFVHSETATMFSGYENETVDRRLEEARRTTDRDERFGRYAEVQHILQRDLPIGWLTYYTNVVATRAGVEAYRPHPIESCYHLENVTDQQ
ncbi:ABC transporter substrate-binding protein [Halorientalis regularis]|uniref:Peptide/nickel transport system substrate-binding protein n=1 Tax=Halorientalis regularis TaxID=660518 RepID=A0A1G7RWE4_9EURY|nr:ABC transporter substrate-binding protein [Halorientalis regularis]SDG14994.1 peptide/nickel transport system substrate-binding protein [Halorientalis regularis]